MCILIVKPANVALPTYEHLYNCSMNNPDGCGFAIPGRAPFRNLDFDKFAKALYEVDEDLPMIIHFRYATHGSICPRNCHPFKNYETGVSFAHNGVLNIQPYKDMTDSETAFKTLFVPAIRRGGLYGHQLKREVNAIIGTSKFAFLDDDGNLLKFGNFIEENGVFYSNTSFMYNRRAYSKRFLDFISL